MFYCKSHFILLAWEINITLLSFHGFCPLKDRSNGTVSLTFKARLIIFICKGNFVSLLLIFFVMLVTWDLFKKLIASLKLNGNICMEVSLSAAEVYICY